jgi:hypothetical protein
MRDRNAEDDPQLRCERYPARREAGTHPGGSLGNPVRRPGSSTGVGMKPDSGARRRDARPRPTLDRRGFFHRYAACTALQPPLGEDITQLFGTRCSRGFGVIVCPCVEGRNHGESPSRGRRHSLRNTDSNVHCTNVNANWLFFPKIARILGYKARSVECVCRKLRRTLRCEPSGFPSGARAATCELAGKAERMLGQHAVG